MKKLIACVISIIMMCIAGCGYPSEPTDNPRWYTFSGENPLLAISNGKILCTDTREEMSGGKLIVKQACSAAAYSVKFYIQKADDSREVLMSPPPLCPSEGFASGDGIGKLFGAVGAILKEGISEADLLERLYAEIEIEYEDKSIQTIQLKLNVQRIEIWSLLLQAQSAYSLHICGLFVCAYLRDFTY